MLRVLDLFSGIGGVSLGLECAGGFKTAAFCEIDPFCQQVLSKHWPDVPIYPDIRELTGERLRQDGIVADVVTGGFPCQPFSTASRGRRVAPDLWPEQLRLCIECRPRYVIAENVQRAPIERAARDLRGNGWGAFCRRISASQAGAPHTRSRWWLCAYPDDESELYRAVDAEVAKLPELCAGVWGWENYSSAIRVSDGLSNRVDRTRALGNAVLPFIPEAYGRAIFQANERVRVGA